MDRQILYPLELALETDFLSISRFAHEGLGLLALDVLGPSPVVTGMTCVPTTPASLNIQISAGRLYQLMPLDANPYGQLTGSNPAGGLAADISGSHQIMKQGKLRDPVNIACAAPTTSGTSVNYLIEAQLQENDVGTSVLQFFNTQNPSTPFSGPNGSGLTNPTVRACQVVLNTKTGVPGPSGTQITPSTDPGWIGLYVVTVTAGQTAIIAANITTLPGAPFLGQTLQQIVQSLGSPPGTTAIDVSTTANQITASLSPPLTAYTPNFVFRIIPANANTGAVLANFNGLGNLSVVKPDGSPLLQGDIQPGVAFEVIIKSGPTLQMLAWPQPPLDKRQAVMTANFTAAAGVFYPVDTSGGPVSVTLPLGPKYGDRCGFGDPVGAWQSNNATFKGNGSLIQGSSANFPGNINSISGEFVYRGGSYGWVWEF